MGNSALRSLSILVIAIDVSCVLEIAASAQQQPLTPGVVTVTGGPSTCSGGGWLTGANMQCYTATITCPNAGPVVVQAINLTFGFASVANAKGLVVLFSGEGGTDPEIYPGNDSQFAFQYWTNGYNVIQTQWANDWELANFTPTLGYASVLEAACRPAGFLSWARNNTAQAQNGPVVFPQTSGAGMCAHGFSAGSAAIGYALTWYGAGNKAAPGAGAGLDKVELLSGPVLSDIEQGCIVPKGNSVNICGGSPSYCHGWPAVGVSQDPIYVQGTQSLVRSWTADPTCRRTDGGTTSSQSNSAWLAQSIVNQAGGTFSYPSTNVQAWLCAPPLGSGQTNESAPQGALYYAQVASGTSPFFDVFAVTGCQGPEGVAQGNVSSANGNVLYPGEAALTAIGDDMSNSQKTETQFCRQSLGH